MRDRKYVKKSLATLRNIQKHQNIQGLPSTTLELAAILENGGKFKKFWKHIFHTREIPPFSVNSVCKITTVALLSGTPCIGMWVGCFACTRACAPCSPAPCFLRLRDTLLRRYVRQPALRCANQSGGNNYAVYSVAGCSLPVTTSFNTQRNTDIRSTTVREKSGEIKSS